MEKIVITLVVLTGSVLSIENTTCTLELQELLSNLSTYYDRGDNSLTLHWTENNDIQSICGTRNFSIELWRAIKAPNSNVPVDFGTREYFSKFQNCDSPNPDLLWLHGDSIHASVDKEDLRIFDSWQDEKIRFYHVVERQYMLRICPCRKAHLPCTCEHAGQSVAVCSEILNISNTGEEQVFPWCRGDISSSPTPLIGVPVLHHCPAKENIYNNM